MSVFNSASFHIKRFTWNKNTSLLQDTYYQDIILFIQLNLLT